YLWPKYLIPTIDQCEDLMNLMKCDKYIHKILIDKFIQIIEFRYSTIKNWEKKKFNMVHKVSIDENIILTENSLPCHLKEIFFCYNFNKPLHKNIFPESVSHITFSESFNQSLKIGVLPPKLIHLYFDIDFNKPISENVL